MFKTIENNIGNSCNLYKLILIAISITLSFSLGTVFAGQSIDAEFIAAELSYPVAIIDIEVLKILLYLGYTYMETFARERYGVL